MSDIKLGQIIQTKLKSFYKKYYLNTLKLNDWENRFEQFRINEEIKIGKKFFDETKLKSESLENKKILIVGAGTGAEAFYLAQLSNSHITLLEPDPEAIEILNLKVNYFHLKNVQITEAFAEDMPFPNEQFDIILCYTVLEHVNDYQKSIDEMYRCTNKLGQIILFLPNYAYPEEPHYKITTFPPAYFPILVRTHLKIKKRYTPFFETLNFLTSKKLKSFLRKRNMSFSQLKVLPKFGEVNFLIFIYSNLFGIVRNQKYFIQKN